ncbi:hypothetical protein [Paracoccus sp. ME4]|uniref:hypothetical protein n=1 Tax=Paracoccus sp. ME4 TaxID=3138066 RepID=UPI00398A71D3
MQNLFHYGMHGTIVGTGMFGVAMSAFGDWDTASRSIDLAMSGDSRAAMIEFLRFTADGIDELSRATNEFFEMAKEIARTEWQAFAEDRMHPFKALSDFFSGLPGGDTIQQWADYFGKKLGAPFGSAGSFIEKYSSAALSFIGTTIVPLAVTGFAAKKTIKALSTCANAAASAFARINGGIAGAIRRIRGMPEPAIPPVYDVLRDGVPDALTGDPKKHHALHEKLTDGFQEGSMPKHVAQGMADTLMAHFIALKDAGTDLKAQIAEKDERLRDQDEHIAEQRRRLEAQEELIASLRREVAKIGHDVAALSSRNDPAGDGPSPG